MDPYWMYRVKKGEVESKLFTSKKEPKGWYDSPKAAKAGIKAKADELEKKLGKHDDDSSGLNKLFG